MAWQQVRCTGREFEQNIFATQQHRSVLEHMADSTFCLILPGNSQSSQRLTEAFLAGCIPVFIGPPWHSLPLTQKVHGRPLWAACMATPGCIPRRTTSACMLGDHRPSQELLLNRVSDPACTGMAGGLCHGGAVPEHLHAGAGGGAGSLVAAPRGEDEGRAGPAHAGAHTLRQPLVVRF